MTIDLGSAAGYEEDLGEVNKRLASRGVLALALMNWLIGWDLHQTSL